MTSYSLCLMLPCLRVKKSLCHAEALAAATKQIKLSHEAHARAKSNADSSARQADKLTEKLANMPKVTLHPASSDHIYRLWIGNSTVHSSNDLSGLKSTTRTIQPLNAKVA